MKDHPLKTKEITKNRNESDVFTTIAISMEPRLNHRGSSSKTREITKIRNEGGGLLRNWKKKKKKKNCIKKNLTHGFHRDCFFLHECNVCTLVVTLYQIVYRGNGFQEVLV